MTIFGPKPKMLPRCPRCRYGHDERIPCPEPGLGLPVDIVARVEQIDRRAGKVIDLWRDPKYPLDAVILFADILRVLGRTP